MSEKTTDQTLHAKLTKKFLMGLPEGGYIVSNVFSKYNMPCFAEKVSSIANREKQWKEIVAAQANQLLCHVFKDEEQFSKWFDSIVKPKPNKG